jgi:hypothetical protein
LIVEVLHGDRCQLVALAIERVRAALTPFVSRADVEVRLIRVDTMDDALRLGCRGSPTVRVAGVDVDPRAAARPFGTHPRGFYADGVIDRVPPASWIVAALEHALERFSLPSKLGLADVGRVL